MVNTESISVQHLPDICMALITLALRYSPSTDYLGNLAQFHQIVTMDYKKAEEYYERAYQADPTHPNNVCNYLIFLCVVKRDFNHPMMKKRIFLLNPEFFVYASDISPDSKYCGIACLYSSTQHVNLFSSFCHVCAATFELRQGDGRAIGSFALLNQYVLPLFHMALASCLCYYVLVLSWSSRTH